MILHSKPDLKGAYGALNLAKLAETKARSLSLFKQFEWPDSAINDGNSFATTWHENSVTYDGMRHKLTHQQHGVCRETKQNGEIREA